MVPYSPASTPLRLACIGVTLGAIFAASARPARAQPPAAATDLPRPVLVELFTSEGCSDCPPADALLAELDKRQVVGDAQVIVLSEHVTYWNHQGWRDPFSFDAIDERQQEYARSLGVSDVYTPQMVVDGTEQFVGSNVAKLQSALDTEAAKPKVPVRIENAHAEPDGAVAFSVHLPADTKGSLVAAVAEDATVTQVSRGENAGRTLHNVAVVRVLKEFNANVGDGRPLELKGSDLAAAEKDGTPLRLVVFLARHSGDRVLGAAEQALRP